MRLLATLAVALALSPAARAEEEVAVGLPAPGFTLRTLNPGESGVATVSLDRYVGAEAEDAEAKVVLLSFFASWCGPCKKEMPYLQQLNLMYRDQGLRVLSVNIDREEAGIAAGRKMASAARATFPVLSDRFNFLARRYLGEEARLPSVFLIARDGTIARIERGYGKDAAGFLLGEVQRALGLAAKTARAAE
jgi:thiol-disulfide isomerase/thioredoxin